MKDCPSCGASVPDSAAQCPSCRHAFEEELEKGQTLMGVPAEEIPSSADREEEGSESDETAELLDASSEQDSKSTHFGVPAVDADAEESPEIDTSADGPDDEATDWSDLDDVIGDSGAAILEASSDSAVEEGAPSDSSPSGASEEEAGDGEGVGEQRSEEDESGVGARSGDPDDKKKTQMGMPRFDPNRVAGEASEETPEEESEGAESSEESPAEGPRMGAAVDLEDESEENYDRTREMSLEELQEEDDEPDPSSTMFGKAAKALAGAGESSAAEAADEREGEKTPIAISEESSEGDAADEEGPIRQTRSGLFGRNTYIQGGEEESEGIEGAEESSELEVSDREEGPEGESPEEEAANRTLLGQPLQSESAEASGVERDRDEPSRPGVSDRDADREKTSGESEHEEEPSAPELEGAGEESAESFDGPTGFEIAGEDEGRSVEGAGSDFDWGPEPDRERSAGDEEGSGEEFRAIGEGTETPDSGGPELDSGVRLAPSSATEEVFETIEEESSDAISDAELEEVESPDGGEEAEGEFEFFESQGESEEESSEAAEAGGEGRALSDEQETVQVERPNGIDEQIDRQSGAAKAALAESELEPDSGREEGIGDETEPESGGEREVPTKRVGTVDDMAQQMSGFVGGLVLAAFAAGQILTTGPGTHFLRFALTVSSGLGGIASFAMPFLPVASGVRSAIYLGVGVLVAALSVSTLVAVVQGLSVGPLVALCGAVLVVAAGLIPAFLAGADS